MLEGTQSSRVWAPHWAVRELLMTRIASSKPVCRSSSTYFDLCSHLAYDRSRPWCHQDLMSVFLSFYQYSPPSFFGVSLHFPLTPAVSISLALSPPSPLFSSVFFLRPAHLLRDPALCLPVWAGQRTDDPCVDDNHHIACMPALLLAPSLFSCSSPLWPVCQLTSTKPIAAPTSPSLHLPCHTSAFWQAHSAPTMPLSHSFHL